MARTAQKDRINTHVKEFYGVEPEYLWEKTPNTYVFRNNINKKWFGAILDIPKSKLGFDDEKIVYVLNVKCDPLIVGELQKQKGFFPAYHMNKDKWISIILDDTVKDDTIFYLLEQSYSLIKEKSKKGEK